MEIKKNPNVDLARKSGFFFSIALLITMSLVLTAFEWRQHETAIGDIVHTGTDMFELGDVPVTEILPPPPPPMPAPVIIEVPDNPEVPNDIKTVIDISTTPDPLPPIEFKPVDIPVEETDEPLLAPGSPATFDGGMAAFYKYVSQKIKYPAQANRMGIDGKVHVEFVINRDGSISEAKAITRIGGGCDEEAVRVIENSPKWNPGKQSGKTVRQRMVLPIWFKLN